MFFLPNSTRKEGLKVTPWTDRKLWANAGKTAASGGAFVTNVYCAFSFQWAFWSLHAPQEFWRYEWHFSITQITARTMRIDKVLYFGRFCRLLRASKAGIWRLSMMQVNVVGFMMMKFKFWAFCELKNCISERICRAILFKLGSAGSGEREGANLPSSWQK